MIYDIKKLVLSILMPIFLFSGSYVNEEGQLIVDNEPFFIMGMFADHYGASYNYKMGTIDSFIVAGFNTIKTSVMDEEWQTEAILNYANVNDIKLIYDGAINNEWKTFHIAGMQRYKDNPGLLGWYIVDDSHGVPPDTIEMYYNQAKEIDPNHITTHSMALSCWSDYGASHIQDRIEYCDVLQMQSYPIGKEPIDEVYRDMRTTIEAAESYKKPVVVDLQLFNWKLTGHDWGCWPTEKEVELMTWLAIAAGVDGYLYYTYNDDLNPPSQPLSKTQSQLWKIVKQTAQKVNYLKSDFLNYEKFYIRNPQPNQYYGQWITDNFTTLIAINTSETDSLYFNIPLVEEDLIPEIIFEDYSGSLTVTGRFLKGFLAPMSIQFYRLYQKSTDVFEYSSTVPSSVTVYPNPFNNVTIIEFFLPKPEKIKIEIFNISGQKIKSFKEVKTSGQYQYYWYGYDNESNRVPSGLYFCNISVGKEISRKKMIFLK